jgi:hypothetical protein
MANNSSSPPGGSYAGYHTCPLAYCRDDAYYPEQAIRTSGYAVLARPVSPEDVGKHVEAVLRQGLAAPRQHT